MKSSHARVIHPFRRSGRNEPGYSQPKQQQPVQQATQQPAAAPVRRVAPGNDVTAAYLAGRAKGTLTEPSIAAAPHEHGVTIRIDGHRHRIPEGVEVAFSHKGRDIVYLLRPAHSVVVLVAVSGVGVRELKSVPRNVLSDIRDEYFPEPR